jgi:hypothetical protein
MCLVKDDERNSRGIPKVAVVPIGAFGNKTMNPRMVAVTWREIFEVNAQLAALADEFGLWLFFCRHVLPSAKGGPTGSDLLIIYHAKACAKTLRRPMPRCSGYLWADYQSWGIQSVSHRSGNVSFTNSGIAHVCTGPVLS